MAIFDYLAAKGGEERAGKKDPFAFDGEIAVTVPGNDVAVVDHGGDYNREIKSQPQILSSNIFVLL